MDRHLKERLVGAMVIVALGIIVIPWLLDGPGAPAGSTGQVLSLPPAESAGRSYTISLDQPVAAPGAVAQGGGEPVAPRPDAGTVQRSEPPAPQPTASPPAQPAAPPKTAQPRPSPAAREPAPPAPGGSPPAASGEWAVQVGSFSQADNAERLRSRLDTLGFEAFVSRAVTDAGTMHRVQVGPAPDREAAEVLMARLGRAGQMGRVVRVED